MDLIEATVTTHGSNGWAQQPHGTRRPLRGLGRDDLGLRRLGLAVLRQRPAGQEGEPLGGDRSGLGAVDEEGEADIGGELHALVVQLEFADDGVVQALEAGAVERDLVRGPADSELLAARRELPDEVGERLVVRVPAGRGPEDGDAGVGGALPVVEEVAGAGAQERESDGVRRPDGIAEDLRVQGMPEDVGGQEVATVVPDPGGRAEGVGRTGTAPPSSLRVTPPGRPRSRRRGR